MISVGSREKGLKGGEGEGEEEEESGGRMGMEVILLDLLDNRRLCQCTIGLSISSPLVSTLRSRSCSPFEMTKWERMRNEEDSLDSTLRTRNHYLSLV